MKDAKQQIETLVKLAKKHDLIPMWTHFYRADNWGFKKLGLTSCLLVNPSFEPISRGISVVSTKDNGSKINGRLLSIKRAFKAAISDKYQKEVIATKEILDYDYKTSDYKSERFTNNNPVNVTNSIERDRLKHKKVKVNLA